MRLINYRLCILEFRRRYQQVGEMIRAGPEVEKSGDQNSAKVLSQVNNLGLVQCTPITLRGA